MIQFVLKSSRVQYSTMHKFVFILIGILFIKSPWPGVNSTSIESVVSKYPVIKFAREYSQHNLTFFINRVALRPGSWIVNALRTATVL